MKVLITGGAGFIGSHLADFYLERENEVFVLDNLSTGSLDNLKEYFDNPKLHLWIRDISNCYNELEYHIERCDLVFHLAAAVGVKNILENPVRSILTNIKGTEYILELCTKHNKPLLITSTSEVYGDNSDTLYEGNDCIIGNPWHIRWGYAISKLLDESLAIAYSKTQGTKVTIARLFNTIGQRQSPEYGMVVPRFIRAAREDKDIEVYGNGEQTRTFTYIDDVITCLDKMIRSSICYGFIFNVGGQEEISILNLAKKIKQMLNSNSEIVFVKKPYKEDLRDMRRRFPNCSKLHTAIGYAPDTTLDEMLKRIIGGNI